MEKQHLTLDQALKDFYEDKVDTQTVRNASLDEVEYVVELLQQTEVPERKTTKFWIFDLLEQFMRHGNKDKINS